MRVVIQRVTDASVTIDGNIKSKIGHGLLILVGIEDLDTTNDSDWLAGKVTILLAFAHLEKVRSLSKVLLFISLLIWSGIHFMQLEQLKAYYKTQHTGESWQQFGAL